MENCPMAVVFSADDDLRRVIMAGLGRLGCATYDGSQAEALAHAAQKPIDVVVVDAGRFDAIRGEATCTARRGSAQWRPCSQASSRKPAT